jgi:hypothetical protein
MRVDKSSGLEDTPRQVNGTNGELAEEFLDLWRDADLPVYHAAKTEYAKLLKK